LAARRDAGYRSPKPVFIVGFPRCGSTLLEEKLSGHPEIAALGERPEFQKILRLIGKNHPTRPQYPDWAPDLPAPALERFGRHYVETFENRHPSAHRLIDKNLGNFLSVGLVKAMLPDASVIHCRRNPIDSCLSCYFMKMPPEHAYKITLRSLGHYYRRYADLMDHWRAVGIDITTVQYEVFLENPDAEYARVLKAIGLDDSRELVRRARPIATSSAFQARQPVYKTSVGRWRNYEKHLGPLIEALGDLV
jgi:hypothetical protein